MKKLGILIGGFAALAIAFAGAPDVNAVATDWGTGAGEATSLPCINGGTPAGAACEGSEWKLTGDITLSNLVIYNGATTNVTIDLNGHSIVSNNAIALINSSTLNIKDSTGKGYIKSTGGGRGTIYIEVGHFNIENGTLISTVADNGGIIWSKGAKTSTANATSVTVGKDAVLKYETPGYGYGVSVDTRYDDNGKPAGWSYGVVMQIDGTVEGGVYVNGTIQHKDNAPQITIGSNAILKGIGDGYPGVYAAGYAHWVIEDGVTITGEGSALAIKSGNITVKGGTYTSTGADTTPTSGYSNGINTSGATIQIEANPDYAGEVNLLIQGGTFISENGRVFYEYLDDDATETAVSSVVINGGDFVSKAGKDVFMVSNEFAETITGFVHGGTFSSDPTAYASPDVKFAKNANGTYSVATETDDGGEAKTTETNPGTSDNVMLYAALGLVGLAGLTGSVALIKKNS